MSDLIHRAHATPRFGSGGQRATIQAALHAVFGFVRTAVFRAGKLIVAAAEVIAEARIQRAMLEAEIHFGRYRRWPENDDRSNERTS